MVFFDSRALLKICATFQEQQQQLANKRLALATNGCTAARKEAAAPGGDLTFSARNVWTEPTKSLLANDKLIFMLSR